MIHSNGKAMPINDTNYNCHNYNSCRTCSTNHIGSISCNIIPLVINNLRDGHTHKCTHTHTDAHTQTYTQTHTHKHTHTNNFKKPGGPATGQHVPGLKMLFTKQIIHIKHTLHNILLIIKVLRYH